MTNYDLMNVEPTIQGVSFLSNKSLDTRKVEWKEIICIEVSNTFTRKVL